MFILGQKWADMFTSAELKQQYQPTNPIENNKIPYIPKHDEINQAI